MKSGNGSRAMGVDCGVEEEEELANANEFPTPNKEFPPLSKDESASGLPIAAVAADPKSSCWCWSTGGIKPVVEGRTQEIAAVGSK